MRVKGIEKDSSHFTLWVLALCKCVQNGRPVEREDEASFIIQRTILINTNSFSGPKQ